VRSDPSQPQVERLFLGAVDDALSKDDEVALARELETDAALRVRFEAYRGAVKALRDAPKERAPDALASLILRRSRRRRGQVRRADERVAFRVPAEVVIPLLLAALVALFMLLASP